MYADDADQIGMGMELDEATGGHFFSGIDSETPSAPVASTKT